MCQMRVILEDDGNQETVMENVTLLETTSEGVKVSALFEEPKTIASVQVKQIDFMGGLVTLVKGKDNQG